MKPHDVSFLMKTKALNIMSWIKHKVVSISTRIFFPCKYDSFELLNELVLESSLVEKTSLPTN